MTELVTTSNRKPLKVAIYIRQASSRPDFADSLEKQKKELAKAYELLEGKVTEIVEELAARDEQDEKRND
jgi:hypothetical protein